MQKILAMTDLQGQLRKLADEVANSHEPYIMTRGDKPTVALVPYDDYVVGRRRSQILAEFDALWARMAKRTAHLSEEEIAADVAAARAELLG